MRWIFPGELETAVAGWFGRFTAATESREDAYLLPHMPGLSVKIRGGAALEMKVYQGSPGILDVAGRARGRMESWQKWSCCAVELTEVITGGEAWWTLAFEAAGSADLVRSDIEATAAFVFAQALPGKMELGMNDSWSYAEWLWRRSS